MEAGNARFESRGGGTFKVPDQGSFAEGGKGGEALKNALASGTYDTPIGKLAFNDLHEVQKSLQVQIVKDKAFHRHSVISDAVLLAPPSKPK